MTTWPNGSSRMDEAARDRVAALRELRDLGWSLGDISNVTGISRPFLHRCCVFELTGGHDIVGPDLFPEADRAATPGRVTTCIDGVTT